jgi:hypothetical protein
MRIRSFFKMLSGGSVCGAPATHSIRGGLIIKGDKGTHKIPAARVLEWSRADTRFLRVETIRDVVPGGLAMAMAPVLVKWGESSLGFGPEDHYSVRNVNLFGDPISGITLLGGVRIPTASVERVEFVLAISKLANREADIAGHAMLRFVFKEDGRPLVLGDKSMAATHDWSLSDLILSWEAWRPPRAGFNPIAGLDPEKYALTLRAYTGSCRCIADTILDRSWRCYPLRFPDVPHFAEELLYLSLLLGDAVARHTIGGLLQHRITRQTDAPADYEDPEEEDWETVMHSLRDQDIPEDPIQDILGGSISYQLLLRSCVTMALMSIDWAMVRAYRRAGRSDPPRIRVAPDTIPAMLDELAHGHRRAALMRVPAALHWLVHHQTVVPGKSEKLLDEVGLLERDRSRIVMRHYDNRIESPYGKPKENLIY